MFLQSSDHPIRSPVSKRKTQDIERQKNNSMLDLRFTMVSDPHPSLLPYTALPEWLRTLSGAAGQFSAILRNAEHDAVDGYRHTIREICQQPATWPDTARRMKESRVRIGRFLADC